MLLLCALVGCDPWPKICIEGKCTNPDDGPQGPQDLAILAMPVRPEVFFPRTENFIMGTDGVSANGYDQPSFPVAVNAFYLDKTEVTVAEYRRCVAAGVCSAAGATGNCNYGFTIHENHPINCVDHSQATSFCAWISRRLPTEEELEFAARGPTSTRFAWGSTNPVAAQLCWNRQGLDTCIEGSYPLNSAAGLSDLVGNVWEWTSSRLCDYPDRTLNCLANAYVIRGSSWVDTDLKVIQASTRQANLASTRVDNCGMRCARNGP